ncbi:MAG: hypothetical protein QXU46_01200 [Candidatus Bathyarchaeia archaeon]
MVFLDFKDHKENFRKYHGHDSVLDLRPGDIVEVRGENEIGKTLDENNCLDGLPFMPEMRKYCGGRFEVLNCVNRMFVEGVGNRTVKNVVNLKGVICTGEFHEGCKRSCVLLWKTAWIKKVQGEPSKESVNVLNYSVPVYQGNMQSDADSCQLMSLERATSPLPISFEDFVRQYVCQKFQSFELVNKICSFFLWLNFKVQRFLGRKKYATLRGKLHRTPSVSLNLQPGEIVEVKSKDEILATLDFRGRNRGLHFTAEMLKYCGRRYRVLKRVDKMIVEKTGKLREIPNTVILEGVTCDGSDHGNCPRNCYCLWREIWLKRV